MGEVSRRNFLRVAAAGGVGLGLTACGLNGDSTPDSPVACRLVDPSTA